MKRRKVGKSERGGFCPVGMRGRRERAGGGHKMKWGEKGNGNTTGPQET